MPKFNKIDNRAPLAFNENLREHRQLACAFRQLAEDCRWQLQREIPDTQHRGGGILYGEPVESMKGCWEIMLYRRIVFGRGSTAAYVQMI